MGSRLSARLWHALLALVAGLVMVTSIASLPGALGASPNYVITGTVTQPTTQVGVSAGVVVQLTSSATHAVYTTTTNSGGGFTFNSANTNGALGIGWWGLAVQPQGGINSKGCSLAANVCGVLPESSAPHYYWESASSLTVNVPRNIGNVTIVGYTATVNATVKTGLGGPVAGATVQLISPRYPGFALSQNTTNATGVTTFLAPPGTWLLYTNASAHPSQFNYSTVTVPGSGTIHVPITINNDYVFGSITSSTGGLVTAGFNQTLVDTTSGAYQYSTYSQFDPIGYSYSVGAYPTGFTGSGNETFELILSPVGYSPAFLGISIPADSGTNHPVVVNPIAPPAVYNTTLNFTSGAGGSAFGLLNVTTTAHLGNYSVFPDLPNASIGQLWGQLALDFDHSLTFTNASFAADVLPWIAAQGPFFPAGQANALINGTGFGQPINYTTTHPNPAITGGYAVNYGLASAQGLSMKWNQHYNVTAGLPKAGTGGAYTIAFNFRHPTSGQSINYTIVLPKGYVLKAGTAAPPNSVLVPAGPAQTWTKFYLDSKPSATAYDTANFTVVKYGNISARVNVSVPTFTFSTKNVLNQSRTNYTVVLGLGENATFSAVNSTYPAGTNGTAFAWTFGDSGTNFTHQPTTNHIYTSTGKFVDTLMVTSSGGQTNQISFTVYVGNLPPTASIEGNWTAVQNQTISGDQYIIVNWSTSLSFNLSGSFSTLYAGAPFGVISVANWNLTSHNFTAILANYSAAAGANTSNPVSYSFQGAGNYLHAGLVDGNSVTPFLGWQYNLTLTVWDGQGQSASKSLVILVRDTEKPVAAILAYNAAGNLIPTSGTVEGPNSVAYVRLSAKNSTDPHNGSIASYVWYLNNTGNSSVNETNHNLSWLQYLAPQSKPYTVNLTVTDLAGNIGYTVYQLTVAYNTTTRPILSVTNQTGPTSMTAGDSYTWWVNITNIGGKLSTAQNVQLLISLTGTTATGPGGNTAGTPGSVKFYNVTAKGVVGTTVQTPPIHLVWNQTVRAVVTFAPGITGTKFLWANATCNNQYTSGPNLAHVQVTISQNQTQLILEYAAIGVGALAVIIALILLFRHRKKAASAPPKGGGRLERGSSSSKSDKDEDEDDDT
jgi:hypothetical protein